LEREQKVIGKGRKVDFEYPFSGIEGLDLVKRKGYIYFTLSNEKFGSRSCLNFIQVYITSIFPLKI
jgi:hypothetical protein